VTQRHPPNIGNGTTTFVIGQSAMDSTPLQLFTSEEILERISTRSLTGLIHIYNQRDTANVFFKNGTIVAAAKGLIEGEDAVRQALDLKEPRYSWLTDVTPVMPPYKPIQVEMKDLLDRHAAHKVSPEVKNAALPVAPAPTMEIPQPAPPPFLTPSRGGSGMTTTLPRLEAPSTVQASKSGSTSTTHVPTASKTASTLPIPVPIDPPSQRKAQYSFVAVDNPRQRVRLTKESTLVGRNPACDIALDHGSISRQHCLMQVTDRGLHVKDLGTTNGTKVNGINLTEGYINPGDQLTMGHLVFVLEKD
jgi:hypothetical protein